MRILILAVLMLIPTRMMAAELLAGPMISHTTTSSAIIWVRDRRASKGHSRLLDTNGQSNDDHPRSSRDHDLRELSPHRHYNTERIYAEHEGSLRDFGKWETGKSSCSPGIPNNARHATAAK